MDNPEFDSFLIAYIETALWSSIDTINGEDICLDEYQGELSMQAKVQMRADCGGFLYRLPNKLAELYDIEQLAHDFCLTRNHHGAGFWDGDYLKPHGKYLTKLAKTFPEQSLYIGDDGQIYI